MFAAVVSVLYTFLTCTGKNPIGTESNVTVLPPMVSTFKSPVAPIYKTQPLFASCKFNTDEAEYIT